MPTNTLTAANIHWQNLNIGVANRHLMQQLQANFNMVDVAGNVICPATKQMNGARLRAVDLFAAPPPANLPGYPGALGIGDVVVWCIRNGDFVITAITRNRGALPASPVVSLVKQHTDVDVAVSSAGHQVGSSINLNVQIVNLRLMPIHIIKLGHPLVKGGAKKNPDLCKACKTITEKNLCYYWKTADRVLYVGSATPYTNNNSSVMGRVLNYLQSHRFDKKGKPVTNKRVFDGVNAQLAHSDVEFGRFVFNFITVRDFTFDYGVVSTNRHVFELLEYTLIGYYKCQGQAPLNL